MLYMFSNYFFDKNTQILDIYSIPMLFSLFSLGNAQNLSETDTLYTLVIDKNDSFNEDRYEFAYTTIDCLQRIAKKETSKESQQEDAFVIKAIITSITGAIMESVCLNNKGEFNKKEAEELLEYLINNANQINVLYKEEGLKPIKLNSNSSYKKGSIFNSKLYKMFNILCA